MNRWDSEFNSSRLRLDSDCLSEEVVDEISDDSDDSVSLGFYGTSELLVSFNWNKEFSI